MTPASKAERFRTRFSLAYLTSQIMVRPAVNFDRESFEMSSSTCASATGSFQNQTSVASDKTTCSNSAILSQSVRKRSET